MHEYACADASGLEALPANEPRKPAALLRPPPVNPRDLRLGSFIDKLWETDGDDNAKLFDWVGCRRVYCDSIRPTPLDVAGRFEEI